MISDADSEEQDPENITEWQFPDSDPEDPDFDEDDEVPESDDEPYPGLPHLIHRFEFRDLLDDRAKPPVLLDDPEAALDDPADRDWPEEEDEPSEDEQVAELSDLEVDFGDGEDQELPEEPPLDIDPDDAEVSSMEL